MKNIKLTGFCLVFCFAFWGDVQARARHSTADTLTMRGLSSPVEIIKDRWGVSHIYAQTQPDLFFAQGFNAARDRLFQFEMWRRRALGLLAEIQGKKALEHDVGARLLKLRQNIDREMNHYHPDGKEIITAFVRGINAYIDLTKKNPALLPIEFKLLGVTPGKWTPEIVVSRHNGLYRNVFAEANIAQAVHALGGKMVEDLMNFQPGKPDLAPKQGLDLSLISDKVVEIYRASRYPPDFEPADIVLPEYRAAKDTRIGDVDLQPKPVFDLVEYVETIGSNNWVLSGKKTFSGFPIMANDPHRRQSIPSLRYWAHLNAPGWNAIGGGEPALPGLSIGHNDHGAWGLTIFSIDQEDLMVYETNPGNPNQYRYRGRWQNMEIIDDTIPVKNAPPVAVELKYTRHGPVIYEDIENHKAYALKAAWLEIGAAPYLASLRMDQAKSWQEFREACSYSGTPSENMVWADKYGNIGWQAVGMAPLRNGWDGVLPVPGDGRFEWSGYLPIKSLPHVYNPPEGHFATANQNNIPKDYPYFMGLSWADPFRFNRLEEVLNSGRKFTITDNMLLQNDELAIPARALAPLLRHLHPKNKAVRQAMDLLLSWDYVLDMHSASAAIYVAWQRRLAQKVRALYVPEAGRNYIRRLPLTKLINWLTAPDGHFGENPTAGRDAVLLESLELAVGDLTKIFGGNLQKWQYGREKFHHIKYEHILSDAVNSELRKKLNIGPLPRGGYGYTVNNTSNGNNQTSGASFRIIADAGDWDRSVGTNTPGQSGDPDHPHYADLFEMWATGKYFPVFFSRQKVESVAASVNVLKPE